MIPNPILLDVTPSGGLLLDVTGDPGDLAGLTLYGQHGPTATVEVQTDGATWAAVTYPYTLTAGAQLRLIRTDTSAALTTIRAAFPDGGDGGGAVVQDPDGYLRPAGETGNGGEVS